MNENDYQKLRLTLLGAAGVIKMLARHLPSLVVDAMLSEIADSLEVTDKCKNESAAAS